MNAARRKEVEALKAQAGEPVQIRNPKYKWKPAYFGDRCSACFENFDLDKCDNCGSGHDDEFIDTEPLKVQAGEPKKKAWNPTDNEMTEKTFIARFIVICVVAVLTQIVTVIDVAVVWKIIANLVLLAVCLEFARVVIRNEK